MGYAIGEDAMDDDLIREHIARVAARDDLGRQRLIARVADGCWPGGSADRSEPIGLLWLRQWRPERSIAALPVCSCAAGRCTVCN